jgi:protoporphyrinogen oxidase
VDGTVVRVPDAYPVYRIGYEQPLDVVVSWLRAFDNLQCVGRGGMFKYNNADHSILTALLAVENLDGASHDLWAVNTDSEYHEVRKT